MRRNLSQSPDLGTFTEEKLNEKLFCVCSCLGMAAKIILEGLR